VDCNVWTGATGLCGVNAGCPDGTRRRFGTCYNDCVPDATCVFTCGLLSANATACSGTETTGLTGPGSWSYSGCGGSGKCRATCNSGYHAVLGGCEKDALPSSINNCGCASCPLGSYCESWKGQTNCICYIPAGYWGRTNFGGGVAYGYWSNTSGSVCSRDDPAWVKGPGCWFSVSIFGTMDLCWEMTTTTPATDDICNY
jgi:hypothetical protein